jgi:nickel-dependent lactate racemase
VVDTLLRYGAHASVSLALRDEALVAHCAAPRGQIVADVGAAARHALQAPIGFPPLTQAVLPGDNVALALAAGVPRAETIVRVAVESLMAAGVAANDITLVRTIEDIQHGAADPLAALAPAIAGQIESLVHDPAQRQSLSYLAASADGKPIYLHRALHDADLVISIGCLRPEGTLGYHGVGETLFPTFSDTASVRRYRSPKARGPSRHERLCKEAEEVGWLLGAPFTIQVVPGGGDDVLHILTGDPVAAARAGRALCDEAWSFSLDERAALVIATIEGDASQQTWDNMARALATSECAVSDDGCVALCTELAEPTGEALQRLIGAENLDEALRDIAKTAPSDALSASELARALARGKVYLVSRLDDDLVEELGMSPIRAEQLSKLAERYESCVVVHNAHRAAVRADEPRMDEPKAAHGRSQR